MSRGFLKYTCNTVLARWTHVLIITCQSFAVESTFVLCVSNSNVAGCVAGAYTDTTSLGDLSKWWDLPSGWAGYLYYPKHFVLFLLLPSLSWRFSVRRTREGHISALFHSSGSGDEAIALAFKKSIVGLFSIGGDEGWSRGVNADSKPQLNSHSSRQYGGQLKTTSKACNLAFPPPFDSIVVSTI